MKVLLGISLLYHTLKRPACFEVTRKPIVSECQEYNSFAWLFEFFGTTRFGIDLNKYKRPNNSIGKVDESS